MRNIIKYIFISFALSFSPCVGFAQLKKTAEIENVKRFTNGSVLLTKTTTENGETYSVLLRNNSKFHDDVVFLLGNKETAIKNLKDFSETLDHAKNGDHFDFTVMGITYSLAYGSTLGQKCFKIWNPHSTNTDFGRLYKATIDDIIKFFLNDKGDVK